MTTIAMPADLYLGRQSFRQRRFDISESSDVTGAQAARLLGPPRWSMGMASPQPTSMLSGAKWEALLAKLRGGVNILSAWDVNKPAPLGTMRGSPVLSANATAGATTIAISGAGASATLLTGDWLQLGTGHGSSQLVKVVTDVTATGGGAMAAVAIEPPIRKQINAASVVVWDKPLGFYRMLGNDWAWEAVPGAILTQGYSIELLEDFG